MDRQGPGVKRPSLAFRQVSSASKTSAPCRTPGRRSGRRKYASADARPRPRTDWDGLAPLQETARAERPQEGDAQAQVLRETLRGAPPRQVAQAKRHPQGQGASPERLVRGADQA